jgi:predicted ATPase
MIDTCESPDTSNEIRWIAVVDVFYDSVMELIINSVEHM